MKKGAAKKATTKKAAARKPRALSVAKLRDEAAWAIQEKLAAGKKLTAADYDFLREVEGEKAAARAVEEAGGMVGELEELLEEWVVCDGVVQGRIRRLDEFGDVEGELLRVQRELLRRYGFEAGQRRGRLSGAERQGLQWVKSIEQLAKASQEWELQMHQLRQQRDRGMPVSMEDFQAMTATVKQLCDRRDTLVLRVRELSARERRSGTGRGEKGNRFEIVIDNGELA